MSESIAQKLIDAGNAWAFACFKTHSSGREEFDKLEEAKEAFKQLAQEVEDMLMAADSIIGNNKVVMESYLEREALWRELDKRWKQAYVWALTKNDEVMQEEEFKTVGKLRNQLGLVEE